MLTRSAIGRVEPAPQFGRQRHRPHGLAGGVAVGGDPVAEVVLTHRADDPRAERDELAAGQRRGLDQVVGLVLDGARRSRRPGSAVPRRRCRRPRPCARRAGSGCPTGGRSFPTAGSRPSGTVATTSTGSLSCAAAITAAITAAAPPMSDFIHDMLRGLDVQAAGVEGDALADERDLGPRPGRPVGQPDRAGVGGPTPLRRRGCRRTCPRRSARSSSTSTVTPAASAAARARSANVAGYRSFGGVFTRSRTNVTPAATDLGAPQRLAQLGVAGRRDGDVDAGQRGRLRARSCTR